MNGTENNNATTNDIDNATTNANVENNERAIVSTIAKKRRRSLKRNRINNSSNSNEYQMSNLNIDRIDNLDSLDSIDYQNNNVTINELFLTNDEFSDVFIQKDICNIKNEKEKLIKMFDYIIDDFKCYLSSDNISLIKNMFVNKKPSIINLRSSYGKYCLSFKLSKKFHEDPIKYIHNNSLEKFEYFKHFRHVSQYVLLAIYLNVDDANDGETASFKTDTVSYDFENKQKELYITAYDVLAVEKINKKENKRARKNVFPGLSLIFVKDC